MRLTEIDLYRRSDKWMATVGGIRAESTIGVTPEEAIQKLQVVYPELKGKEIIYRGVI